ncbi:hypothetical protein Ahy_A02g009904 [Arachis hypogaea]|uniref:ABC transporter domain-containing protein n=1 Tax=Arachis hypogaea TaxID=3818 RepID=A0A445EIK2_ARAHY|nr:hypothetical protein Ahy_A02g009904 [Arachis hypogaea]
MQGSDIYRASNTSRTRSSTLWRNRTAREVFSNEREEDDEEALKWASLEKLPTYNRLRKGLLTTSRGVANEIDITELGFQDRQKLLDRLIKVAEEDNDKFLLKLRERIDRVGIDIPTIEVRFEHLNVEAEAYVGSRAMPTFINFATNLVENVLTFFHILPSKKKQVTILKNVGDEFQNSKHKGSIVTSTKNISGIIKPRRMTLLLGLPSSGKTTLLLALSGKLDPSLKVSGKVSYNGHEMNEFVPQRTAAYISQHDVHIGEMTVRETLTFSARCQGVGSRYDLLSELSRREKEAKIKPDVDIDVYMKATATGGHEASLVTDYVLKILGLDICADTIVGNEMLRGISGGQRKRVTTGEMLVGPTNALFMDEISTGLDSSTTFQIVNSLKQYVHILNGTALISLLQPAPETYELFDDIVLISDGEIVYQGPREHVLDFFEYVGFKCPERKAVADFLQEVTSKKDQEQYWARKEQPYRFITITEFVEAFQSFHVGRRMGDELATPFDKSLNHPAALTTNKYGISKKELLKANFSREYLLMKRNSFVYIFKLFQLTLVAIIEMTLFLRTKMHRESVYDGIVYSGALFLSVVMIMFNGMAEISMTIAKLPVYYKQRDNLFYPPWACAIPNWILKIPLSLLEVADWIILTYYVIGYDPNVCRFLKQYLVLFLTSQMASSLFRAIAAIGRNLIVANTFGSVALLAFFVLGGFVLSRTFEKQQATIIDESEGKTSNGIAQEVQLPRIESSTRVSTSSNSSNNGKKKGMVLPFEPHSITFDQIVYSVDMPQEMKNQGVVEDRLVLLKGVSGAFRPGVLTALMGVSEAGKTTLMDVLAGRKTSGYIDGSIKISGYSKKQETFARISGYCEQTDIHSPHMFIEEVMELVELNLLRNSLVGLAGVSGLSTEQRKRLTIAVELVANPSIIFMDEPTSGLDARAAAIVMRTVRNTVDTGRTVVCTIHQPSIDIFEAFDERGGQEIYVGPLGHRSRQLINYFESIDGVSKIKDGYNPSTWMLEVTTPAQELNLGVDFHEIYKNSDLYRRNKNLIAELGNPTPASKDLYFQTQYSQPFLVQCLACLWKQHWSYWRNPLSSSQDIFNAMGVAVLFIGIQNSASVQPVVAIERVVFYKERAARMYSALPYAIAQVMIELPYIFAQAVTYGVIVYAMIGFEWNVKKLFWYIFFMYFTFCYFTFYGMMAVAATPNHHIGSILAAAFYGIWNVFSGFVIPRTRMPVWWKWYCWVCPVSWTLYGLVASQFGDITHVMESEPISVQDFIRLYYGFKHDIIGVCAIMVSGFAVLFALIFAVAIKLFNFQKR